MKRFSTYLTLLLFFSVQLAKADIGETHALKQERSQILSEIKHLQSDSISTKDAAVLNTLHHKVLELDDEIFASYDQTISRISSQNLERSSSNKLAVYVAMGATALALFFILLLIMAKSKIKNNETMTLLQLNRELSRDLIGNLSPDQHTTKRSLRVNAVVLVGLVLMGISIMAYLLTIL